jgi:anti-sigma regulatory factor (Ser/Thr protein kinase)
LSQAEFHLNGELSELRVLASEMARFCQENSLPTDVEFDLYLVVEELFTNAIRHGGCAGLSEAAQVRLGTGANGVIVEFRDRGNPFDPASAPLPDLTASLQDAGAGGLGIHLVKQLLQDLSYERIDGWNRMTGTRKQDGE